MTEGRYTDPAWRWVCAIAIFAYSTLETMLVPALSQIRAAIGLSVSETGWIFTSLLMSGAVATPLMGRAADIWGAERVLLLVLAAIAFGIVLAATATNFWTLITGQALQGFGLALVPLSVAITRSAGAAKVIVIAATSSTVAGFFLASLLLKLGDYHILYWTSLGPILVCLASAIAMARRAGGLAATSEKLDLIGAALLAIGFVTFLVGFDQSDLWRNTGITFAGMTALAAWWRHSIRRSDAIFDVRSIVRGDVTGPIAVIAATTGVGAFASFLIIPVLAALPTAVGGLQTTPTFASLCLSGFGVMGAVTPIFVARLGKLVGARIVVQMGIMAILAGLALIAAPASIATLLAASAAIGAGIGLVLTQSIVLLEENIAPDRLASATAMMFVTKSLGGAVGAQLSAILLGDAASATAVVAPLLFAGTFCGVALVASLRLPATPKKAAA